MLAAYLTEGPMTILDPAGATRRIRIDAAQFADELAKRVPDTDQIDLGKARDAAGEAVHDAAALARVTLDDLVERLRTIASTTTMRAVVARLEKELPETDRDRYDRAYARGRVQARSIYLAVGIAAGVTAGVAAAALLDPRHGKERRDRIARRTGELTAGLRSRATSTARMAQDRAKAVARDRGLAEPEVDVPGTTGLAAPADPSAGTTETAPVTLPEGAVPVMADPAPVPPEGDAAPSAQA
jgi:hypothetical protein